jgi:hypothetical protein
MGQIAETGRNDKLVASPKALAAQKCQPSPDSSSTLSAQRLPHSVAFRGDEFLRGAKSVASVRIG